MNDEPRNATVYDASGRGDGRIRDLERRVAELEAQAELTQATDGKEQPASEGA